MSAAFELLGIDTTGRGTKGGDTNNPTYHPQHRRAELNAPIDPETGLPGLHQFKDSARVGLKNAQGWHQMAAWMLLAHRTNADIAKAAGVTQDAVSLLRAQRWFQQLLATLANEEGQAVQALIASEAAASVEKLVQLRDFSESDRVALAAATFLVEQANGKARQTIHSTVVRGGSFASPEDELHAIEQQLSDLRQSQKPILDVAPASEQPTS